MTQVGSQSMDIIFTGKKKLGTMTAHRREIVDYIKKLDDDEKVETYDVSVELEEWADTISLVGVRKAYHEADWTTDCLIQYKDGTQAVREFVKREWLKKRAEVEKLEISRRYWAARQVYDWGVYIVDYTEEGE